MSTALLHRVLADHPDARVDIVCGPGAAPLFTGLPQLARLLPLKKKKCHRHYIDLYRQLSGTAYDLIIDLRTPLLGRILKGKKKILFRKSTDAATNRAAQFARLWPGKWPNTAPVRTQVWAGEDAVQQARNLLTPFAGRRVCALAPTANWLGKQWPQKYFAFTCAELSRSHPDLCFVVLGAAHEEPRVADLIASLPPERKLNLVGKTDIAAAAAVIGEADLLIGNDSGLAHLAGSTGTPAVVLFGPMNDALYAPTGEKIYVITPPVRARREVNMAPEALPRLITDIAPELVTAAAQQVLSQKT